MEADEVKTFASLAEESSKINESFGELFNEAARDPAIIFRHNSGCFVQPGVLCNCTFARMNFTEMSDLNAAAESGLVGLNIKPTISLRLTIKENQVLCNIASYFGVVTAARAGNEPVPKPLSALRMMTTGDETGRCFWGPNGIWTKFLASARTAVTELRAPSRSSA
jgi:hypothetical protein